jgi:NAD(P)H-hydrate epimerase
MKILSVEEIREADIFTIKNEPIQDIDLMERAAKACFQWINTHIPHESRFLVLCGSGNNGGDGLALARMLVLGGRAVEVLVVGSKEKLTRSNLLNYKRLEDVIFNQAIEKGLSESGFVKFLGPEDPLPEIKSGTVVVDALYGSGITREIAGYEAELVGYINKCNAPVVSIDVPSGLFCDKTNHTTENPVVVRACTTLTFAPPKLALFFPENGPYTGEWVLLEIGIMHEFIDSCPSRNFMIDAGLCQALLKKRKKFAHKGTYGHALLICGSRGKMGACILAARACLRSGPGLVTVRVPGTGLSIVQPAVPEAMALPDPDDAVFSSLPDLSPYSCVAIGPGIGCEQPTAGALKLLIQESSRPIIFDADAINILSENKTWLAFLPPGCIFTPHPKEFERLVGKSSDDYDRNRMQRDFSFRYQCTVVLKGAHTAITAPDGRCYFNSTGNPGMATGGSGDVLTGILAGLSAQGYPPLESCILGVYLHGLAGDLALAKLGYEALNAGDIVDFLGNAFQSLYGKF